jgi:hypothetical protein
LLAGKSELAAHFAILIDSEKTVEFQFAANTFQTKHGTFSIFKYGGAVAVGADESLTGNTQVFFHPNAASIAQNAIGNNLLGTLYSNDGRNLDFYNDLVDAHEFGHAYGNAILGKSLRYSNSSNPYALRLENYVRERRRHPNRRIRH